MRAWSSRKVGTGEEYSLASDKGTEGGVVGEGEPVEEEMEEVEEEMEEVEIMEEVEVTEVGMEMEEDWGQGVYIFLKLSCPCNLSGWLGVSFLQDVWHDGSVRVSMSEQWRIVSGGNVRDSMSDQWIISCAGRFPCQHMNERHDLHDEMHEGARMAQLD
eukprot:CAMPEP_0118930414 /NCGR_PEP_ID=MMETSP1169-20130426/7111_1 /TAXON_ID=36882 /ORGANISM="Pyramimonas obovata, Strain CCMP722" /LENGTH=158 /DNA_ID=CAMNT_0006872767 /DNA_START=320 /DNA_END=794 /DNA_ORIENTATION=+